MKLYVARHGETLWNSEGRILGRTDMPLNETGRGQAAALAQAMRGAGLGVVLTSPLLRAKQTGEAVAAATGAPLREDIRLIEQDFGSFEGTDRLAGGYLDAKMNFAARLPGGGESLFDLAYRVYDLLYEVRRVYPGQAVFLATHNSVMRIIETFFRDVPTGEFRSLSFANAAARQYEL